ncbi:MAG: ParB/RepB/Spo0J family partition protein [Bacteroidaceae bacterium]|jgi:ParB family chromosome partitioning protein|nr:ParB/RepB/Spo0J family partition protein [Bacteroidales bacterium]MBQ4039051.1 ParB/RepB/Spo0J family partition protein [Bacteroidaceae bacterium]MBR6805694.1 ParB/RepB/Spo0J family partition protein [Bacteroidaceae bacterium]
MAKKQFTLGRGLDALISTEAVRTSGSSSIGEIALSQIEPNPNQPRREFSEESLRELADSIIEIGIVQPITLRQIDEERYQIIAGERRFRASQLAGKETIPAYIITADDESTMEMALVENIQREDLNALEIALAYQKLIEQNNFSQEQLSKRVGKGRATIANFLRLLKLPAPVQMALKEKQIDMGHARALLSLDDPKQQIKLFNEIQKNGYSVRQVEEIVRQMKEEGYDAAKKKENKQQENVAVFSQLKKQLTHFFQTPVQLTCSPKGNGKISIKFKNEEELERIISIFDKMKS